MSGLCKHCGKPLNKSQYSKNRQFKSCPKCSSKDGQEHIYYPYPGAFGTSIERESSCQPDGPQSWCTSCRPQDSVGGPYLGAKRCSELK